MANVIRGAAAKANIGWVSGRVVDVDGHAIPGAIVTWQGWLVVEGPTNPETMVFTATADSGGKFRLGIPAGPANVLWFEAPGYARLRLGDEQVPEVAAFPEETNDLGDILLAPENAIVGCVTDGDGPISGARLQASPYVHQLAHTIADNGPPITAVTASDGKFRLGSLPMGDIAVNIEVPGHAAQRRFARFAHGNRLVDFGEIRFVGERTEVRGTVVDDQGAPVPGARVHANEDKEVFAVTDAAGAFLLSARSANVHRVSVRKAGFIGYSTIRENPQHVEFKIQRAFYLEGIVQDARTGKAVLIEDLSVCEVRRREADGTLSYVG